MANHNNHSNPTPPILLTIAGFDPSCGAGTAADLKTFAAHGCYGVAHASGLAGAIIGNSAGGFDEYEVLQAAFDCRLP